MYKLSTFIKYLNILLLGSSAFSLQAAAHMQENCAKDVRGNHSLNIDIIVDAEDTVESPFLLLSELRVVGSKPDGKFSGHLMTGINDGRRWIVKQMPVDACAREYIAGSILSLWANKNIPGANFPSIKLIKDKAVFVASEILPNFKTAEQQIMADFGYSSESLMVFLGGILLKDVDQLHNTTGREFRLLTEMLLNLGDRHTGNVGFIDEDGHLEYASIDFDQSLIPFSLELDVQVAQWSKIGDYRKCILPVNASVMEAFLGSLLNYDTFPLPTSTSYINKQNLVGAIEALLDVPIETIEETIRSAAKALQENGVNVNNAWIESIICHVYLKQQVMESLLETIKNYPEEIIEVKPNSQEGYGVALLYTLISLIEKAHKYFPSII